MVICSHHLNLGSGRLVKLGREDVLVWGEIALFLVPIAAVLGYFFARPFVDHIVWTRPAVAPFVG